MSTRGASRKKLRIGALEERTGLTRDAIHHYVREGLVPPPEKTSATVAWFDQRHVARLRSIRVLRDEGLPVAAVKRLLEDPAIAAMSGEQLAALARSLVAVGLREVPRASVCDERGRSLASALRMADRVDENPALADALNALSSSLTPALMVALEREVMPSLRTTARAYVEEQRTLDNEVTARVAATVAERIGALFTAALAEALTARALASRKRTLSGGGRKA
ncbi:MAG: MerR family transcriptional regulator [Polyangiales bacterium]